jgi:hypothetical protein
MSNPEFFQVTLGGLLGSSIATAILGALSVHQSTDDRIFIDLDGYHAWVATSRSS